MLHETPWLDTAFEYLTHFVGQPIADAPVQKTSPLEEMLQIAIKRKITIAAGILRGMLSKYSRLSLVDAPSDSPAEVRWRLVAAIMQLDPDAFTANEIANPAAVIPRFRTDLVNRITSIPPGEARTTKYMVDKVLGGLVSAFARIKNIGGFLTLWFDQLATTRHEAFGSERLCSLWGTTALFLIVSFHIRESLPSTQQQKFQAYADLIHSLAVDIAGEAQRDAITHLPCWEMGNPALVLMEAMLEAADGQDTLQNCTSVLHRLSRDLVGILGYATAFQRLERRLWHLLLKTQQILCRFASANMIMSHVHYMAMSLKGVYFPAPNASADLSDEAFLFFLRIFRPGISHTMDPKVRDILDGVFAKLVSNCEAILSKEDDKLQLHRDEMVKIALLANCRHSFRSVTSCRPCCSC